MTAGSRRVLVIGLDCAAPRFIFGPDAFDLPVVQGLMRKGVWGPLQSCDPPITVPAWSVMTSGKDPGQLGCYGFRDRADRSYDRARIPTSQSIREPRVWDIFSEAKLRSIVLGVPQTYPPYPLNGVMVSGFLTPSTEASYTWPENVKTELEDRLGEYIVDVADFRTDDKAGLENRIWALMVNRFTAAEYLMGRYPWRFFMMVDMGMDRLHHAFWKYCDPDHPKHEPNNPFRNVFRDYYTAIDEKIGELIKRAGDDVTTFIVSDHGAKALHGGFCLNEWLIKEGYLTLRESPAPRSRFEPSMVDWRSSKAWGAGGYCGRIYLNIKGREPEGIVDPGGVEPLRNELITKLESLPGRDGRPMKNRVLKPEDTYRAVGGIAPDLLCYFGELHYRAVGTVGWGGIFTDENDSGPDDANHDFDGVFIMGDGGGPSDERTNLSIMDVAPTVLDHAGLTVPNDMVGEIIRR